MASLRQVERTTDVLRASGSNTPENAATNITARPCRVQAKAAEGTSGDVVRYLGTNIYAEGHTVHPRTQNLDFRGFDSSIFLS